MLKHTVVCFHLSSVAVSMQTPAGHMGIESSSGSSVAVEPLVSTCLHLQSLGDVALDESMSVFQRGVAECWEPSINQSHIQDSMHLSWNNKPPRVEF